MSKKILIVEDEQDVAELVADVLDFEGYETRISSGETAYGDVLSFQPQAILLDLMMPGVDGFEVARRLYADEQTRAVPIVVMTAMHEPEQRAREVGTPYYLAKPFDMDSLLETVHAASA